MRTILVLAGGGATDRTVFDAALAVAKPLGANLEFLHVRLEAGEAAIHTPHVEFARGEALRAALGGLQAEARRRSAAALHHFEELCEREAIDIAISPGGLEPRRVSASWCEERDDSIARIMRCARHNDLTVIGRSARSNGLPPDLAEQVLTNSGRPLLIAADRKRHPPIGAVLICWKETAESARALAAALPLLPAARRVVIASIEEGTGGSPEGLYHLVQRLAWDGVTADARWLTASPIPVAERLQMLAAEIDADLLVMGGYGRGRMREMVFGGCTRHFLDRADQSVLLMH